MNQPKPRESLAEDSGFESDSLCVCVCWEEDDSPVTSSCQGRIGMASESLKENETPIGPDLHILKTDIFLGIVSAINNDYRAKSIS